MFILIIHILSNIFGVAIISLTIKNDSPLPLLQTSRHEERYTKEAPQTCVDEEDDCDDDD